MTRKGAIAVGDSGMILTSADAGASWQPRSSGTDAILFSVTQLENERSIAVGLSGTILTSDDSGASWQERNSGTDALLLSVTMNAKGQAVAIGMGGTILTSSDAGANWQTLQGITSADLKSIVLLADGRAIAVGSAGTILTSSDAGANWQTSTVGDNLELSSVALLTDGRAIAVGDDGVVLTSKNFGVSWQDLTNPAFPNLSSVALLADGRAIATGTGIILTSADAGSNWEPRAGSGGEELFSVAMLPDGRAIVAGRQAIFTTRDSGVFWEQQVRGNDLGLFSVSLSSDRRAIAVGDRGQVLTSSDAGASWQARNSGTADRLRSVSGLRDGNAITVSDRGNIFTTENAGASWQQRSSRTDTGLDSVALQEKGLAVAVGYGGRIRTSVNYGKDWAASSEGLVGQLISAALIADGRAIAVSSGGTILIRSGAAEDWKVSMRETEGGFGLASVALLPDGRSVAVGEAGRVLTSPNSGIKWEVRNSGTNVYLHSISLSPSGQAIAVGEGGTILTSADAGVTWQPRSSGIGISLLSVSMTADGEAIAVGQGGNVLTSTDFGQNWKKIQNMLPYARYPAPWYWLTVVVSLFLLWLGLRSGESSEAHGASTIAASDAPTISAIHDRLNFLPLARGISRFLRHEKTEPPLTLAITGDWGSGKSSLMGLVCEDLRKRNWRPIWFNAWHHQKEEQMLPALLDLLRTTGLPPVFSLPGMSYRLQLLWIRSKKHFATTLLAVFISCLLIGYMVAHQGEGSWNQLAAFASTLSPDPDKWGATSKAWKDLQGNQALANVLAQILAAAPVILAVRNGLKPFGLDPAVLLSSAFSQASIRDLSAQTGFRTKFAREFGDVTASLPYPVTIVIDDLDRCKTETVLEIMEAVNFLTSSGRCFVIFGMARERVQAALALSFKDIAKEIAEFDLLPTDTQPDEKVQRDKRQRYAEDYLEKLINIEVLVPNRKDIAPHLLLQQAPEDEAKSLRERLSSVAKPLLLASFVFLAATIGLYQGREFSPQPSGTASLVSAAGPETSKEQDPLPSSTSKTDQQPAIAKLTFAPGDNRGISLFWFVGSFALGALGAGIMLLRRLQKQVLMVTDTSAFKDALRIWSPIAAFTRNSPRSIKRFGNRIRYLAMLQQGAQLDDRPWLDEAVETAWKTLRMRFGIRSRLPGQQREYAEKERGLSEHRVVALGALHACFGNAGWRVHCEQTSLTSQRESSEIGQRIFDAINAYTTATGAAWPPSDKELDAFERSLKGVRLSGESELIETETANEAGYSNLYNLKEGSAFRKRPPVK